MNQAFTGRHMLACCIGFFGTVIAVNMVMAVQASRTFGGTVVENSYVASQHFNRWLGEAKAEGQLGWRVEVVREDGHVVLTLIGPRDADVSGVAEHPLGRKDDVPLRFVAAGKGHFRSVEKLPAGRWRLKIDVRAGAERARMIEELGA